MAAFSSSPALLGQNILTGGYRLGFYSENKKVVAYLYEGSSRVGRCPLDSLPIDLWTREILPYLAKERINKFLLENHVPLGEERVSRLFPEGAPLPTELVFLISRELSLKDLSVATQVSELWSNAFREPLERALIRELRELYRQDPVSQEIARFFVKNVETLRSVDAISTSKVRSLFDELWKKIDRENGCSPNFERSKACAHKRWCLWRDCLGANPELLVLEREISFLREIVNEELEKKGGEATFDLLHEGLKKKLEAYSIPYIGGPWDRGYVPLCELFLSLGLVNKDEDEVIRNTIILRTSKYIRERNISIKVSKPLKENNPFLMQLLVYHKVNIKKHLYQRDYKVQSYFHLMLSALDPNHYASRGRQRIREIASESAEVLLEIGRILLQNGVDICHGNIKLATRLNNPALALLVLKKRIALSRAFMTHFNIFTSMEIDNPEFAKSVLYHLEKEKMSLKEAGCDDGDSFLSKVIDYLTLPSYRNHSISDEDWKRGWLEVAELLLKMGDDPNKVVNTESHEESYGCVAYYKTRTTPLEIAQKRGLAELITLFEGSSSIGAAFGPAVRESEATGSGRE